MFVILGLAIIGASIVVGYTMHEGNLAVLIQVNEFIIIGGCGLGALLVANPMSVVKAIITQCIGLLKPNPYSRVAYAELLQVLYEVFHLARREGLVGLEAHVEDPDSSEIFAGYPGFHKNHHAVYFLADTLKVLLTGAVEDHHLADILDLDLEQHQEEAM